MKKESLILGRILRKIAPRIGAEVLIEPEWGIVGQIVFASGKHSYFRYNTLDLNSVGSSDVAKDKDYAYFFMRAMGYPTISDSRTFFSDEWARAIGSHRGIDAAYRYARKLRFPVIVKPNGGSQGAGVALVHNRREFYRAMREVFRRDRVGLVQRYMRGKDYRLVVLDDELISAYERTPLKITGNGRSTILQLLKEKQKRFIARGRDTRIDTQDFRIAWKLRRQGLSLRSIPAKGTEVCLLDNANLSTGWESVDVTERVHPEFRDLAVRLTRDMGLRFSGVDLIVEGDIREKPSLHWILEINAAPGLDHYSRTGRKQRKIVEELYLRVLRHMDK